MKTECFVAILICSLCFNLALAGYAVEAKCRAARERCLANCSNVPYGGCEKMCEQDFQTCLRNSKKGYREPTSKRKKRRRKKIISRSNPRSAVIQFLMRQAKEMIQRF
ncbi:hypothetical protein ScPMuIL_010957 [Solemya velum]